MKTSSLDPNVEFLGVKAIIGLGLPMANLTERISVPGPIGELTKRLDRSGLGLNRLAACVPVA
jgi:hypothetical protein